MPSSDSLLIQLARRNALRFDGPLAERYNPSAKTVPQKNLEKLFYDYNNTPEKRKARVDYDARERARMAAAAPDRGIMSLAAGDTDSDSIQTLSDMDSGINPLARYKTPAALRDVIDTTADTFGNTEFGLSKDTKRAMGRVYDKNGNPVARSGLDLLRNIIPDTADLGYRAYQAGMAGLETGAKLTDDLVDSTGINDSGGVADTVLPGKLRPGSAVMALMEALPDAGLHMTGLPVRLPKAPETLDSVIPPDLSNAPVAPLKTPSSSIRGSDVPSRPYETGLRERSVSLMASMPDNVLNTAKAEAVNRGRIPYPEYVSDIDAIVAKRKPSPDTPTPELTPESFADLAAEKGTEFIDSPEAIDFYTNNAPAIETELGNRAAQNVKEEGDAAPVDNVYRVTGPDGKVRHTTTAEVARREAIDLSKDNSDDQFDAISNHPEETSGDYGDVKIEYGPAEGLMAGPYKGYSPPKDLKPQAVSREPGDGFTGSINTERLPGSPDAIEAVVDAGKEGQIDKKYRSREDTIEASKDVTPEEIRAGVGDLSAKIKAGQNQTTEAAKKFVDTPVDSPEFDSAMEDFLGIAGAHSENVGETARGLEILRTPKTNARGEVAVDTETMRKFHDFVKDPANADKLRELIDRYKNEPDTIKKIVRAIHKPGFEDYIASTWFNMVLSGPITHARNILGNAINLGGDIVGAKSFASVIGQRRRFMKNTDRVMGREVLARVYGAALGTRQGFLNMGKAFKEGVPLDLVGKVENPRVFNGPLSAIEAPTKALAAEDEFFRSVAHMSELYGLATRKVITEHGWMDMDEIQKIVDNPPQDILKKAADYSQVMRFQDEPGIFAKLVQQASHPKKGETLPQRSARLAFRLTVAPFVRTPSSIIRTAIRNSPLGVLESRNIKGWKAGGAERDMAVSRVAVGSAITAIIVGKVLDGDISGDGPTDYRKSADKQSAGWRPKSIRVGDKWYNYDNLGPVSGLIASVANSVEREKELDGKGKSFGDKMAVTATGIADGLVENGWMESVSNVMKVLTAPPGQRQAAINNMVASEASSITVPALFRQINQTYVDPKVRDTTGNGSLGDAIKGRVESGIPGMSTWLPQKMDTFGNPINREGSFGPDILNPITSSSIKTDTTVKELDRLGSTDPEGKALIGPPSKTIKIAGNQVKLSAREFQDYQTVSGQYITKSVAELMSSPGYKELSDDERRGMVNDIKKDARKFAREQLFTPTEANPPKTASKLAADAFPGIPTSIRRTKSGNEAVGGVADSDHLKGDAIDFIPPPGTSMKALEEQAVKFFGPDVRILNEGTHIHVRIPGLNGPLYGTKGAR